MPHAFVVRPSWWFRFVPQIILIVPIRSLSRLPKLKAKLTFVINHHSVTVTAVNPIGPCHCWSRWCLLSPIFFVNLSLRLLTLLTYQQLVVTHASGSWYSSLMSHYSWWSLLITTDRWSLAIPMDHYHLPIMFLYHYPWSLIISHPTDYRSSR